MLLGLNGRLQSGKDTTFLMIEKIQRNKGDAPPVRISFADPLKHSAAAALGTTVEILERLKTKEDLVFSVDVDNAQPGSQTLAYQAPCFNIREYLQRYGTEAHRNIFGEDFWVDIALPQEFDHSDGLYVVTDMRFPNELRRVKDLGGFAIKIERMILTAHGDHPSEQNLDDEIDYFIDNNDSLEQLENKVEHMLFQLRHDIYCGAIATPYASTTQGRLC